MARGKYGKGLVFLRYPGHSHRSLRIVHIILLGLREDSVVLGLNVV